MEKARDGFFECDGLNAVKQCWFTKLHRMLLCSVLAGALQHRMNLLPKRQFAMCHRPISL